MKFLILVFILSMSCQSKKGLKTDKSLVQFEHRQWSIGKEKNLFELLLSDEQKVLNFLNHLKFDFSQSQDILDQLKESLILKDDRFPHSEVLTTSIDLVRTHHIIDYLNGAFSILNKKNLQNKWLVETCFRPDLSILGLDYFVHSQLEEESLIQSDVNDQWKMMIEQLAISSKFNIHNLSGLSKHQLQRYWNSLKLISDSSRIDVSNKSLKVQLAHYIFKFYQDKKSVRISDSELYKTLVSGLSDVEMHHWIGLLKNITEQFPNSDQLNLRKSALQQWFIAKSRTNAKNNRIIAHFKQQDCFSIF